MDVQQKAQQTFERVLKFYEKDDRVALTKEMQQLIAFAAKQGYIDYQMQVLISPTDVE